MTVLQEYKCPCCGGAIEFDTNIQKMKCPYCDAEFEMEALKHYDESLKEEPSEQMNWDTQAGGEWQQGEEDGLRHYICRSCGGEIIADATTAATSCPYCDNPVVMLEQFEGSLRPDYVIPFKLSKEDAKNILRKQYERKILLPTAFKDENHLDEIKGVYVPFWLFDADASANIRYRTTRVRSWTAKDYRHTETLHYAVYRNGNIGFDRIPIDGSSKMPDSKMESLEPYDFSDAVDFQTAYLSGFFADKYDVTAEQSIERANERIKESVEKKFASTVRGYTSVVTESKSINLSSGKAKYALYPVWILNTSWRGKNYNFAINGQTGKFAGTLPADSKKVMKWTLGLTGLISAAAYGFSCLLWYTGLI